MEHKLEISVEDNTCTGRLEGDRFMVVMALAEIMLDNEEITDIIILATQVYQEAKKREQ